MRYRSATTIVLVSLAVGITIISLVRASRQAQADGSLTVQASTDKSTYLPGEAIHLDITITNSTRVPARLHRATTVEGGYLRVSMSRDGAEYRKYTGPGWGAIDAIWPDQMMTLAPGEAFRTKAVVQWNSRPAATTRPVRAPGYIERLESSFATADPGRYFIKVEFLKSVSAETPDSSNSSEWGASEPIVVEVLTPVGSDAAVWEELAKSDAYLYFLQTGEELGAWRGESAKASVPETLKVLLERYPDSAYCAGIRKSLDHHAKNKGRH